MKKLILVAVCAFWIVGLSNARIIKRTYWGQKAQKSWVNPCKGDLVRICGVIEEQVEELTTTTSSVASTLKDEDGVIIDNTYTVVPYSVEEIMEYLSTHMPEGADIEIDLTSKGTD